MYLAYDGIVFDVLLLNGWEQTAIWSDDGADFLYWHHIIDVTCILNPDVLSTKVMPSKKVGALPTDPGRIAKDNVDNRARNVKLNQADLIEKPTPRTDIDSNGEPIKSPIVVPGKSVPPSGVPDPAGKFNYFVDDYGAISQSVDQSVLNYPLVETVFNNSPIAYPLRLGIKTNPIKDPLGINYEDSQSKLPVSPATVDKTSVGYSNSPELQLKTGISNFPHLDADVNIPNNPTISFPPSNVRNVDFPGNPSVPISDTELRDRLQIPRRKLKVWLNTGLNGKPEFILNLPYDGCTVDAKIGPRCVDMNMTAIHGNVTGVKRLIFECWEAFPLFYGQGKSDNPGETPVVQSDAPGLFVGALGLGAIAAKLVDQKVKKIEVLTPPIVSNRWTMRQVPDIETYLNTIVISGKAVFRMDVLNRMKITPDQLRKYIMPPIGVGYIRKPPEVSINSVGNEIEYTIIDEQQMLNNPGGLRWGVHSVLFTQSCVVNNPFDVGETNSKMSGKGQIQSPSMKAVGIIQDK